MAVLVCTRNRPVDLERCLTSLLATRPPDCEIVVVDQSDGPDSAEMVRLVGRHADGLAYVTSRGRGLSVARNEAAAATSADLLLFTDDDCEILSCTWAEDWHRIFATRPSLGIGFGRVVAPPFDPGLGDIPCWAPDGNLGVWGTEVFGRGQQAVGMGANMAVRREAFVAAGGFDEALGAGTEFPGAEDHDMAYRIARKGYRLAHAWAPTVLHHGFRPAVEAHRLYRGYASAVGAMYAKHVRCGDSRALIFAMREIARLAGYVAKSALTGRRPTNLTRLGGLLAGLLSSRGHEVDRELRVYRSGFAGGMPQGVRR